MGREVGYGIESLMKPAQVQLLRRLALNDAPSMIYVMTGGVAEFKPPDARTAALVEIAALVSVAPDATSFQWAVDQAIAAGVEDEQIFSVLLEVAPIVGLVRLIAALPHLMEAVGLEVVDG